MDFGWAHLTDMARARDDMLRSWLWDGFYEVCLGVGLRCRQNHTVEANGCAFPGRRSTGAAAAAAQGLPIFLVWPRCSQLRRFTNRMECVCAHFVLEASYFFLVGNNPLFLPLLASCYVFDDSTLL